MLQSLPQRLYLLTYTVDEGKFKLGDLQGRGQLLRAGALAEMVLGGLLGVEGRKVVRLTDEPPSDSFLAGVWGDLPGEKPKGWLQFVHNKAHTAEAPVQEQLSAAGTITVTRKKLLGLVAGSHVTVNDPQQVLDLRARVRDVVMSGSDPATVPMDELTMAVFAKELELTSVFHRKEVSEHKRTLKALADRFDKAVPKLRSSLRDSYLSSRAVGGGWSNS
ncbi:GPP34 family phosphoprotein [Streptomyces sp. NPDC057307]|uniref:GOLPH3/VPS74 family protein n=1 Tax=Streptomyces sp. NPDC057307 TaxID=3346096 RepID=UPI003627FE0D